MIGLSQGFDFGRPKKVNEEQKLLAKRLLGLLHFYHLLNLTRSDLAAIMY